MKRLSSILLLFFVSVLFFQCQREVSFNGSTNTENTNPDPLTAHVNGIVLDENDQPAAGVDIKVGNKTAITDSRGYFRINNAALDKKASLVAASKAGYFDAYRTFSATSGTNNVVIKLITKSLVGTVSAASGGDVTLSNGAKISLPANGMVDLTTGAAFSGTVNVYAAYIDPTDSDIDQTVPGSLMANDANNNRVQMASYGMMAVELESAAGAKLQIKTGSKATLTTPIPSVLQASAPNSIPMWYLDEESGLWEEEGSAVKTGNVYVGDVKHFTFWNCDINLPAVTLSFTIKNNDNLPLVHVHVAIVRTAAPNAGSAHGYTDSLGQVSGLVPANEALVMKILDDCGNQIYSQNIGPFTQATNLGTIVLTNLGQSAVTFSGTVVSCNATPVSNGYVIIYQGGLVRYAATSANGSFHVAFTQCAGSSATASVIAVDGANLQQSSPVTVAITTPATNAGTITACGTSTAEFINYTLDGTNYTVTDPVSDSLFAYTTDLGATNHHTYITGAPNTSGPNFMGLRFSHTTLGPGTYPIDQIMVNQFMQGNTLLSPSEVVLTTFPPVGQFYEGTFSGQFKDPANVTHSFNGTFRVRRIQ